MNRTITLLIAAVLACLSGVPAKAHHSASAYDETRSMSVSGVVTRLQWRNPHVIIRLEVEGEDGSKSQWPLETAGIQQMIRDGWNKDLVGPGQRLTAEIHPTKTGVPGGILRWVTLADGRVLSVDAAAPAGDQYTSGDEGASDAADDSLQSKARISLADYKARRAAVEKQEASNRPAKLPLVAEDGQKAALDPDNLAAHKNVALYDFTGVWQHRSFRELSKEKGGMPWEFLPLPKLTPKAAAIRADVLARREAGDATADPAALCYPHGLQRTMTRAGNMMLLQVETAVFMVHRMNNDFRAVYWDGRDHVDASVRVDTYNGDSIAYWADDHLYVETVGFGSPFHYINPGVPIGAQGRVEERWRLINEGNTLEIEFRMTDPEHWEGEWIDTKFWDRIYGADIREANCIVAEDAELAIGRQ
jgi:hypothetical protein